MGIEKYQGTSCIALTHPSDVKRDGICIYYKTRQSLKVLSTNFLRECINFGVSIGNKICRFIHLYRTPSQSQDEFHDFLTNLEMNLDDDFRTSQFVLFQIIKEPTHILKNSSSCIDLIFTTQPSMALQSRVHHSLHQNCHHQIIFAKFNLKVYYPPPYERTKQFLIIFNKQLISLIGKTLSLILMLMTKCPFFPKLS